MERRETQMKFYRVKYNGVYEGTVTAAFDNEDAAYDFYKKTSHCNKPEEFIATNPEEIEYWKWCCQEYQL